MIKSILVPMGTSDSSVALSLKKYEIKMDLYNSNNFHYLESCPCRHVTSGMDEIYSDIHLWPLTRLAL